MSSPSLLHQGQSVAAICRLCFMEQVPTDLEPIFDDDSGYLSEWIEKLTSLKVSEAFSITNVPNAPTSLCSSCKSTLEAFDSFREMCITNDHVFKETFCQDTRRWGELTDENEVETDGDQQTEDVVERNLNALSKSRIHAEQEENEVSVIQLLVDVYESDTCDETDGKDRDINQEGNLEEPMEATFAEDAIQTEYEQMDGNIGSDEHTAQIDVANRTVNSYPMSDCRQYPCKICKSFVSKLHILTHKETYLFECYICSGRVQRYKYMSKHFYRWHREIMIGMPAETDIDHINYQYNNENNFQVQPGNNSMPSTGTDNFDFITESAPIAYICKICMQATSKLHATSHKAVGVFLCNVCNKTFDRIGLLTMHAKSHSKNQNSGVSKNASNEIIDLCDDQPEGTPVSTEGDFEAQIVGHTIPIGRGAKKDDSRLKTSEEYGKNLRTVNGERFFCTICNNFVSELHQTTHKGKDLFTCTCLQTFPRFALLSKHVQSHSHSETWTQRQYFIKANRLQRYVVYSDDNSGHLSKWIEKLTSLKIINIPNSPVSLCSNCKHTLEAFDSFREMCLTNDIAFKETFCPNKIQERELTDVSIKVEFGEEQLSFEQGDDVPSTKPSIDINQAKFQYVGIYGQDQENQNEQIKQDNQTAEETDSSEDDYEMQTMENALLVDSGVQSNGTNSIANATKPDRKIVPLYEGRFLCNVCDKQVTKLHHSTHKAQQLFECYICKNTFRKFANLSRHIHNHIRKEKYHHKDSTTGNDHQEAGPSSSNQEAVRNGADILMDRDYECKMCNKTVSSLHALNHKPEGFRCPICESLFQRFDCFGRHVRCHKSKGKYACDICRMRFPSTYRMGRHRRLHFGNKP